MHDGSKLDFSGRHRDPYYVRNLKTNKNELVPQEKVDMFSGKQDVEHYDLDSLAHHLGKDKRGVQRGQLHFQKQAKAVRYRHGAGVSANFVPSNRQLEESIRGHKKSGNRFMYADYNHPTEKHHVASQEFEKPTVGKLQAFYNKHHEAAIHKAIPGQAGTITEGKQKRLADRYWMQGLSISIENAKGSYRAGKSRDGHEWKTYMHYDYGYLRNTVGKDGEQLDVYVGPNRNSVKVFVVRQVNPKTGKYDEDKTLLGFDSKEQAKKAYLRQYDTPKFFGSIREIPIDAFKLMLKKHKGKRLTNDARFMEKSNPILFVDLNKAVTEEKDIKDQERNLVPAGVANPVTPDREDKGEDWHNTVKSLVVLL
jgi:hypothetical protein